MPLGPMSGVPPSDVRRRPVRRMDESNLVQQIYGSAPTSTEFTNACSCSMFNVRSSPTARRLYAKSAQEFAPPGWPSPNVRNSKRANPVR
jgi:hypothetical protein